jgi:hypothetical protein
MRNPPSVAGGGPARWTRRHLDRLVETPATTAPALGPSAPARALPGHDLWDPWPVQEPDGSPAVMSGSELWMALSAPATGHPEERHDLARIRLLTRSGGSWQDHGPVFADGTSPGSREWSGCAVRRPDGTISIFYTAAGWRGEARPTFHQRIIEARPRLTVDRADVRLDRRVAHHEVLRCVGDTYLPANEDEGGPGQIRAFRDPGWFRDPADGREYLLVAACVPWGDRHMGAIALADAILHQPPRLPARGRGADRPVRLRRPHPDRTVRTPQRLRARHPEPRHVSRPGVRLARSSGPQRGQLHQLPGSEWLRPRAGPGDRGTSAVRRHGRPAAPPRPRQRRLIPLLGGCHADGVGATTAASGRPLSRFSLAYIFQSLNGTRPHAAVFGELGGGSIQPGRCTSRPGDP